MRKGERGKCYERSMEIKENEGCILGSGYDGIERDEVRIFGSGIERHPLLHS